MKKMRKLAALLLAVMMTVGLCATAWASSVPALGSQSSDLGTYGNLGTNVTSITFKNVLVAWNLDETEVYAPDISFGFAIRPATDEEAGINSGNAGVTVTDSMERQYYVVPGKVGTFNVTYSGVQQTYTVSGTPTITTTVEYTSDKTLSADADGSDANVDSAIVENTKTINEQLVTVNFNGVTFSKNGIYRYVIERTPNAAANNVLNVIDKTQETESLKNKRYLDVYVKENGETGTPTIYGYAMHNMTGDIPDEDENKSDGFYDDYKTSNLIVSKTLVNDSGMNGHQFPFTVEFAETKDAHIYTKQLTNTTYTGNATVAEMDTADVASTPTIAHKGAVKYVGIPIGFTAEVYETNDVTGTIYTSVGAADNAAASKQLTWSGEGAKSNTASTNAATVDANKTVAFTNTLEQISPTGVVLRVAPYVLMLAAGLMLLMLSRRRRIALDD